ncbi:sensor domain-containing diguanylate cyclase [Helicovermis profundi]|uniref:Diguanylate cyclase n=1 Tax=Helicovermis profundi TaxID=3065157 RepID=A0AAU9EKB4_9FIRM|nr:hypothetical protein HLPR_07400 [Clostridia bacterium S502]
MKLKNKLLFLLLSFALLSAFIIIFFVHAIIMKDYYKIENKHFESQYLIADKAINQEFNKYNELIADWAYWDDTYNFVKDRSDEYIKSNITNSTFENLNLDYLAIFNNNDNIVVDFYFDKSNNKLVDIPKEILNQFKKVGFGNSLIFLRGKTIAVTKSRILNSEEEGNSNGSFIFANIFDDDEKIKIENSLNMKLKVKENTADTISEKIKRYKHYSVLSIEKKYFNNSNELLFNFTLSNSISSLGARNVLRISLLISSLFMLLFLLVYYGLQKNIVNRINELSQKVTKVAYDNNLSLRLDVIGEDEIEKLKHDINFMLENIENLNKKLNEYATLDTMTGIKNRREGFRILKKLRKDSLKENKLFCVLFIDIDNLKVVNDKLGHKMGDKMIVDLVNMIKNNISENDFVFRLGGDEFLLVLSELDIKKATKIMQNIYRDIDEYNNINHEFVLDISYGLEEVDYSISLEELIENADKKMYINKQSKKLY